MCSKWASARFSFDTFYSFAFARASSHLFVRGLGGRTLAEISLAVSRLWRDCIRGECVFGEDFVCGKLALARFVLELAGYV